MLIFNGGFLTSSHARQKKKDPESRQKNAREK